MATRGSKACRDTMPAGGAKVRGTIVHVVAGVQLVAGVVAGIAVSSSGGASVAHPALATRTAGPPAGAADATVLMPIAMVVPAAGNPGGSGRHPVATHATAPPCAPAQLRARLQDVKVAVGVVEETYQVEETSGRPCSISASQPAWPER